MLAMQPTVQIQGPPPGPASGRYDVPRPAIAAVGGVILALGVGYLLVRLRRGQR